MTWPEAGPVEDFFLATEAGFAFHGARLRFELARSLFSSAGIDAGSALLLRHLQSLDLAGGERILDLGCGTGVLGVVLHALDPARSIVSADRDALACRYTRRNVALNELDASRHEVLGSLGYDRVDAAERFDLIVSNVPGKAGDRFIDHLVGRALTVAHPGSLLATVVVQPLAPTIGAALEANGVEVVLAKGNKTHQVIIGRLPDGSAGTGDLGNGFESGVYDRDRLSFTSGSASWEARTVIGLGEFDNLSYPTRLLRSALGGIPAQPSVLVNPGQGHRAVIAARGGYPPATVLGRDLLALCATRRLLLDGGCDEPELVHDVTIDAVARPEERRLIIAHAEDKVFAPWFFDQVRRYLDVVQAATVDGPRDLVLTGRASLLGRLEAEVLRRRKGHIAYKESQRGCRSLRYRIG